MVTKLRGADDEGREWEEYKKGEQCPQHFYFRHPEDCTGTYNWPISFMIPLDCPPTIRSEYGSATYRLRAQVIRAGTFTTNLITSAEVIVIASPGDDDTDEMDSIVIERQWEDNLQYLISMSGRAFAIGGTLPLSLNLMPLNKISLYRISIILEEKG